MPSWVALSVTVIVFFVAAWLVSERVSRNLTRQRKLRDNRVVAVATNPDGRPSGW